MLTEQEILLGRGARAESSRVREVKFPKSDKYKHRAKI